MSLLLAIAALALQGADSGSAQPITREQAMQLPPREVGRIVLGQIGDLVQSVSRPTAQGVPYPDERLQSLEFGLMPEAGGGGLCSATAISIVFASDAPGVDNDHNRAWRLPVHVRYFTTRQVHKVAGDLDETGRPASPIERARQLARCRSRQVVPTETLDFDQPRYFSLTGPLHPAQAAGIVARILADGASGALNDLRCDPASTHIAPCADPRRILRGLTLDRLTSVESSQSGPGRYNVAAAFSDPDNPDRNMVLEILAEVEVSESRRQLVRIHGATVRRSMIIF